MKKKVRQYIGIIAAVIVYYLVHEGAHFATAVMMGVFRKINIMGIGVQIDVYAERMSNLQMGIFCAAGIIATMIAACVLAAFRTEICEKNSALFRACMYYITLAMLIADPLYLSVLCGFFGGGDMNGISYLIPTVPARITAGILLAAGIGIAWFVILPEYRESFLRIKEA